MSKKIDYSLLSYEEKREYKRRKRARQRLIALIEIYTVFAVILAVIILVVVFAVRHHRAKQREEAVAYVVSMNGGEIAGEADDGEDTDDSKDDGKSEDKEFSEEGEPDPSESEEEDSDSGFAGGAENLTLIETQNTASITGNVVSEHALLIDMSNGTVVAKKGSNARMYPASMTKVLTILVAAENMTEADLDKVVPMTIECTDYAYVNDCSAAGYEVGEQVTVRDLMYGTILPSGGDAAAQLAVYVAGSREAFVDMMNERLEKMGISGTTHFTNMVGIYDDNHYSTCEDMAKIMYAAMQNDICRPVLECHIYTSSSTAEHPDGIELSNLFLRRIEDRDFGGTILGAKTGFVNQSGNCAVSCEKSDSGKYYLCVTTNSSSSWQCIRDHVEIYKNYGK